MKEELKWHNKITAFLKESFSILFKYIWGKILSSLIAGLLAYAIFALTGMKPSWLLGLVIAFFNLIPTIGGLIGGIIVVLIVVFQKAVFVLYAIIIVVFIQIFDNYLISPLVIGKKLDIKPFIILLVSITGGALFGVPGLLLSIPAAAIIKLFYNMFIS